MDRVVLIHGLAETPAHMFALRQAAIVSGYEVECVAYPSTRLPIERLIDEYIQPAIDSTSNARRAHFVTHSLGGVLLHACLQTRIPPNLGRVVMQAPGLQGSEALEIYRHNPLFRWLYGPAAVQSGTGADGFAKQLSDRAEYELGIVSGCLSSDLLPLFFIPPPHDGKISAARTLTGGVQDHIVLPTTHDGIMHDPLAVVQTVRFIRTGAFFHFWKTPRAVSFASVA